MKELLTELRNKVLYLRNTEELSVKGELILLHKLNALEKQLDISGVVVNEDFKPCCEGDNVCKCEDASECGYSSEVEYCECLAPIVRTGSDNGYCANCGNDLR